MDGKVPSRMRRGCSGGWGLGGWLGMSAVGSVRRSIARCTFICGTLEGFMLEPAAVARLLSTSHTWRSGTEQTVPVSRCFLIHRSVSDSTNCCWVVVFFCLFLVC